MSTYAQFAKKIGKSVSFVQKLAQTGQIEIYDLGHRTKLITEKAEADYLAKCKRGATV